MSAAEEISLLGHLQTPILVGDPDGFVVYANPTFRERFCGLGDDPVGESLSLVFGGGAREAVLMATAEVLQRGQAARLKIREGGRSYAGLCSPIEADDDRVGVVMVMLEEDSSEEHLAALADELADPIGDALKSLHDLSERLGADLVDDARGVLERAIGQVETSQKWLRELAIAIRGGKSQLGRFDVAGAVVRVSDRVGHDAPAETDIEVLIGPNLPRVSGANIVFERLLAQLVRQRIEEAREGTPITILAREAGGESPRHVLVSVVDHPDAGRRDPTGHPPDYVQQGLEQMSADSTCVEDGELGRVTSMRLSIAVG